MFSGNDEDPKEYKRWKAWVSSKLLTLSWKMPVEAKGAFIYTCLSGKALEAIEHLEPAELRQRILTLLDKRFPEKDASDEMSENLTEIFNLKASEGETLKGWISRASEAFDKLQRKTNVSFPDEARGWIILHRSGLSSGQQAVVLARSLGVLKQEELGRAMRSCYPEFACPKRKPYGLSLVEDESAGEQEVVDDVNDFEDVEQFLAQHSAIPDDDEVFDEPDIAEALAVTWKERRQDLNRMQKARKFHDASKMKRQFRIEVQELKKRTRCHKCNQVGHWSRECPKGKGQGKGSASSSKSHPKDDTGAAAVEHFVAAVSLIEKYVHTGLRDEVLQRVRSRSNQVIHEQLLVSSRGYGILDSGCGRSIIGRETFESFKVLWNQQGVSCPETFAETNHFRFGNGARETSLEAVKIPVTIADRPGTIKASLVQGSAPLLISRNAMKALSAKMDFATNKLHVFEDQREVPLETNSAGQYVIQLMGNPSAMQSQFEEVMVSEQVVVESDQLAASESPAVAPPKAEHPPDAVEPSASESGVLSEVVPGQVPPGVSVWSRVDPKLRNVNT